MQSLKASLAGLAVWVVLSSPSAAALTVLCVGTASTGFDWREGNWVQQRYTPETYFIQDVSDDAELRGECQAQTIVFPSGGSTPGRCFNMSKMGEKKLSVFTSLCRTFTDNGPAISRVYCDDALLEKYSFVPTGEFVSSRTYAAPETNPVATSERDSLAVTVGQCSVVSP